MLKGVYSPARNLDSHPLLKNHVSRVMLRRQARILGLHGTAFPQKQGTELSLFRNETNVRWLKEKMHKVLFRKPSFEALDRFLHSGGSATIPELAEALVDLESSDNNSSLLLSKESIDINDLWAVAAKGRHVHLPQKSEKELYENRTYLEARVAAGDVIYGVNTGFGSNSNVAISNSDLEQLQLNLIRSHASGLGEPLDEITVRAMLLLRASSLAKGVSGVRPQLVEALIDMLNTGVHPYVSLRGSVGASGDLVPLSQIALVLIGEGQAFYNGELLDGTTALARAGLKPFKLSYKEGLALINGTQFGTALTALALYQSLHLLDLADASAAFTAEVTGSSSDPFNENIHRVRGQQGQITTAERIRNFLFEKGKRSDLYQDHATRNKVQDPYDIRCVPQVHGPVRDLFESAKNIIARELNAVTDNPLIFHHSHFVGSGGNFHAQYPAMAADVLSMGLSTLINISQTRIANLLTNTKNTGLPPFLAENAGLESGLMMLDVNAAALVAEGRLLANPASVLSIPTAGGQEDHVSMAPVAARKAVGLTHLLGSMLSLELASASRALDVLGPQLTTTLLRDIYLKIREGVVPQSGDRPMTDDLAYIEALIATQDFDSFII